jgi:hypothetical protein
MNKCTDILTYYCALHLIGVFTFLLLAGHEVKAAHLFGGAAPAQPSASSQCRTRSFLRSAFRRLQAEIRQGLGIQSM